MQRTMGSYDELHRDVATSYLLAVRPGICTCELDVHDCTSPSRTSETEPSAIIPDFQCRYRANQRFQTVCQLWIEG